MPSILEMGLHILWNFCRTHTEISLKCMRCYAISGLCVVTANFPFWEGCPRISPFKQGLRRVNAFASRSTQRKCPGQSDACFFCLHRKFQNPCLKPEMRGRSLRKPKFDRVLSPCALRCGLRRMLQSRILHCGLHQAPPLCSAPAAGCGWIVLGVIVCLGSGVGLQGKPR